MGKFLKNLLFAIGVICLGLSVYYLVQIIIYDQWNDVTIRSAQLLQFFGGMLMLVLSRI